MTSGTGVNPLLQARNLVKKFGNITAVDGVDLTLYPGECLALLGPNGAGKTTTVEMLEGLQTPTSGDISVFGLDMRRDRSAIMERMGVLLQETNLYKRYTVRETLSLFASFYKSPVDPDQVINRLGLSEKSSVQLKNLSGGQKQRVYLGACLINDPDLIFLDEPTTGLDPQSRRNVWDLLLSLKSGQRGMLLTTHYMEEAERLADRIAIVDHGHIIATGTLDELIQEHCGGKVLTFSLARNHIVLKGDELADAVKALNVSHPVFKDAICTEQNCEIVTDTVGPAVSAVMEGLRTSSYQLQELSVRSGSLEDVFIKLTGRSIRDD